MLRAAASALVLALLAGASAHAAAPVAPQPTRPVDKDRLYLGIWHEIARNPMDITKDCVAGETRFTTNDDGVLMDRNSCRQGDPNTGKEKIFEGAVVFPDPADGAKFRTSYRAFGPFRANRDYWILDHDDAYTWFIASSPNFNDLSIFTRDPQVPQAMKDQLTDRARALGYDVTRLEYPAQPQG